MKPSAAQLVQLSGVGTVELQGTRVRGRFMKPGTFTPHINGKPLPVEFSKAVILDAFERLRAAVAAGSVEIRLTHPDLQGLPLRFGLVKEVRLDREKGEVWLADGVAYPEMEKLLTDQARQTLQDLALSMAAAVRIRQRKDGTWEATRIDVQAVDVVDEGAFHGSWITPTVPVGLEAQAATAPAHAVLFHEFLRLNAAGPHPAASPSLASGAPGAKTQTRGDHQTMKKKTTDANPAPEQEQETHADATAPDQAEGAPETTPPTGEAQELRAKLDKSDARVKDLEAKLEAAKKEKGGLEARIGDAEASIKQLAATAKKLEDEKLAAEAEKDVDDAIVRARKALPAEKPSLLKVRLQVGRDTFSAMMAARQPVAPPIGEKGAVPQDTQDHAMNAAATVEKYGVENTLMARIHEADPSVRAYLAAKHADHPQVRKVLRGDIQALQAAQAASGGGA